jgi:hypothetical protein
MMADPAMIVETYRRLRIEAAGRDARHADMVRARSGRLAEIAPDMFDAAFPHPIVANTIQIAARDTADILAPLPSFTCSSATQVSDRARAFADKRTRIANSYVQESRLQVQMYSGADWFLTFGFLPVRVEIDVEAKAPRIVLDSPIGAYPEFDRWGRVVSYTRVIRSTVANLVVQFPELESRIAGPRPGGHSMGSQIEVLLHNDRDATTMVLPAQPWAHSRACVLASVPNPLGRPLVRVAQLPSVAGEARGEYDDVLWIMLARHRFAMMQMEAAEKAVQAPLALPFDVQELSLGPDAIIRTSKPETIRRVPVELPQSAFAQASTLESEARQAARYPEARSGSMDASVITGKGVQALMGGFDSRIKAAQAMLAETLERIVSDCFEADEVLWPDEARTIRVKDNGTPYSVTYTPSKDIKGDHTVDVTYGLMAGLDPNRALIFGLQARGDRLISRDFLRRQMPWSLNPSEEEMRVDAEELRDSLKQALAAYAQAIPIYAQQGQDPSAVVRGVADIIDGRQKGRAIEDIVREVFPAPPPPQEAENGPETAAEGGVEEQGAPDGGMPPGMASSGLPVGVAQGQATMGPGGRPDLSVLLAGLSSSGSPDMRATITRRQPI